MLRIHSREPADDDKGDEVADFTKATHPRDCPGSRWHSHAQRGRHFRIARGIYPSEGVAQENVMVTLMVHVDAERPAGFDTKPIRVVLKVSCGDTSNVTSK